MFQQRLDSIDQVQPAFTKLDTPDVKRKLEEIESETLEPTTSQPLDDLAPSDLNVRLTTLRDSILDQNLIAADDQFLDSSNKENQ